MAVPLLGPNGEPIFAVAVVGPGGGTTAPDVNVAKYGGTAVSLGQKVMTASEPVVIASDQSAIPTDSTKYGGAAVSLGQKVMASSEPVVIASNQSAIPITNAFDTASTGTETNVAGSATSVTLVASNAARKGAIIANDSTSILYVRLSGTAASTTAYTYQMAGSTSGGISHLEIPYGYIGAITGIWASATGSARVTELT